MSTPTGAEMDAASRTARTDPDSAARIVDKHATNVPEGTGKGTADMATPSRTEMDAASGTTGAGADGAARSADKHTAKVANGTATGAAIMASPSRTEMDTASGASVVANFCGAISSATEGHDSDAEAATP